MFQPRFTSTIILSLTLLLFHTHLQICTSLLSTTLLKHTETDAVITKRVSTKSIGDCLTETELMDSETNRRVLAMQKKYISYDTLKRDKVPCERAGASYYNCHPRQANPYSRGCEVITACARGS
ncbi:protein RALF-like 24 [Vicia villosa]|uniref:protein RALF-like 24 n=1 Tax=Vicia villosa TaxID=3911 RepID=UPI00273B8748|nr:protein RALF-like 24 [Vicia villosa]